MASGSAAGDTAVTGASIVDEAPARFALELRLRHGQRVHETHTFIVTDPTTSEGLRRDKDTSNGAFGNAAQIECTSTRSL